MNESKVKISKDLHATVIEILTTSNKSHLVFLIIWMIGWTFGEFFVIWKIFSGNLAFHDNAFLLFWLTGWTYGGFQIIRYILWKLYGKEVIRLDKGTLEIKKTILWYDKTSLYDVVEITDIYLTPKETKNNKRVLGYKDGAIEFKYKNKTIQFAKEADLHAANEILSYLDKVSTSKLPKS